MAGSKGITIHGRRKGEKVPRKLLLRDGTRLDVLIDERPMMNVIVDKIVTEHKVTNKFANSKVLFNLADAHLPGNGDMRYNIIDNSDLRFIRGLGEQYLCMRRMSSNEVDRLPKSVKLTDTPKVYYKAEPSIDLDAFFRRNDWPGFLGLWITENLAKSWQLLDTFMSNIVPLIPDNWFNDSELSKLQFFNNHCFWMTSTKSGKSELARQVGIVPSTDFSIAGLYGGTVSNGRTTERVMGSLEGHGIHMFDECLYLKSYDDKAVINSLLGYMQQGTATRELKVSTSCRGTKSLIFASNPTKSKDMTSSFLDFLEALSGNDYPDKIGSRIGSVVFGKLPEVRPHGNISEYRGVGYRIIDQCMRRFYMTRIYPILKTNMSWACEISGVKESYLRFSQCTANETVGKFIEGMVHTIPKLGLAAIRLLILENLQSIAVDYEKKRFQKNIIVRNREQVLLRLVSINLQSMALLSHATDSLKPEKNSAVLLRQKFPKMTLRDIGSVLGCSKSSVGRWLNEENLLSDKEEVEIDTKGSEKAV